MQTTHKIRLILSILFLWGCALFIVVEKETLLPSTDVFLFKEAAISLALKGKLTVSNLPHLPADQELQYAYYPPIYPLVFGYWTKLFGVGLKQSLLFNHLLMGLRCLWVLLFLLRLKLLPSPLTVKQGLGLALMGLGLAFVTSEGDRPDELAFLFGLASWGVSLHLFRNQLFSGLCIGLCAATSPAAGVFFALGRAVLTGLETKKKWFALWVCGLVSVVVFGAIFYPVYLSDPSAWAIFQKQVPLSTFPYEFPWKSGFEGFYLTFTRSLFHSIHVGFPYVFCVGVLGLMSWVAYFSGMNSNQKKLVVAATLFVIFVTFVWTLQPYYLWWPCLILMGVWSGKILEMQGKKRAFALIIFLLAVTPLSYRYLRMHVSGIFRASSENPQEVKVKVSKILNKKTRLAVSSDQFFTFRELGEVSNVTYVCDALDSYQYVYLTPKSSRFSSGVSFPCPQKQSCFVAVKNFSDSKKMNVLGFDLPYYFRGAGGILYENQNCS